MTRRRRSPRLRTRCKIRPGEALEFECGRFGAGASERNRLVNWLRERGVAEIVMESTAQYWKPVWMDLEAHFAKLHLAQAHSNRAPKGRKNDFGDAKRLARRLLAGELILSFVPDPDQRMWRDCCHARSLARSDCPRVHGPRQGRLSRKADVSHHRRSKRPGPNGSRNQARAAGRLANNVS
jgi:Transposase